jgi:hypothetical protein
MKLSIVLLAICLAVATASNIRGQEPGLKEEVNAARAATGASEAELASDATGTDDKAGRENAQQDAASGDESKAHVAATEMIATSEKRWGVVSENCAAEAKDTKDWIENPVVNVEKNDQKKTCSREEIAGCINESRRRIKKLHCQNQTYPQTSTQSHHCCKLFVQT